MVHATACNVSRLTMPFVPGSSLALLGVQLACIDAALKDVVTRIEIVRITAAKAAEQEVAQAEQPAAQMGIELATAAHEGSNRIRCRGSA